jgi:hypothetical protein
MTPEAKPPITPRTRVAELLDAYPELEQVLVDAAPPFRKLRNPVLRKTIARVTSLEQAASVAGVPLRDLILTLREAAGLKAEANDIGPPVAVVETSTSDGAAAWADASRVRWTVDADALLAGGEEPITEVVEKTRSLDAGGLGLIRSSFRPAPLIELLEKQGFRIAVVRSGESFATFVGRDDESGKAEHEGSETPG